MVICLTGMHRSGTSLVASYLRSNGIQMGRELVGSAKGNERGHFEDVEFVRFHSSLLRWNRSHMFSPRKTLEFDRRHIEEASALVARRSRQSAIWGWKDPRTTLFLDLWHQVARQIHFVFLYRDPITVMDSLFRRGTDRRLNLAPWIAMNAWKRYNAEVIRFHDAHPEKSSIMCIDGIIANWSESFERLGRTLGMEFRVPGEAVFQKGGIATSRNARTIRARWLGKACGKSLYDLYEQLERRAAVSSEEWCR